MTTVAATTRFTRGETFSPALEATSGDISAATCRMVLKLARLGRPPGDTAAEAAVLTVTAVDHVDPEDITTGPGWVGLLTAEASEALAAGVYLMDARVVLGATVIQTDLVRVLVEERITEEAA